jgi:hypothetical protein
MVSVTLSDHVKSRIRQNALNTVPYTALKDFMPEVEYDGIVVDSELINELLTPYKLEEFVLNNKDVIDNLQYHFNTKTLYDAPNHMSHRISSTGDLEPVNVCDILITTNVPDELINFDAQYDTTTHWRADNYDHSVIRYQPLNTDNEHVFAIKLKGVYTNKVCSYKAQTRKTITSSNRRDTWPTSHTTSEVQFIQWEQLPKIVREACAAYLKLLETLEKRIQIKNDMDRLLSQVRSTSQFLKAFPEGKHLLPSEIIEKMHRQKPKRNTGSNIEAGDLSIIKQSILMDKLGAN